jgi:hypothetical protein
MGVVDTATDSGRVATRPKPRRGRVPDPKLLARSRVTNGADILPNVDARSAIARRYKDVVSAILADQAGATQCTEARQQLIRRFAAAAVIAEQMEARLINGEAISITEHALLASTLVRIARQIGIDRRMRNITPTLGEYLASKQTDAADVEADAGDTANVLDPEAAA